VHQAPPARQGSGGTMNIMNQKNKGALPPLIVNKPSSSPQTRTRRHLFLCWPVNGATIIQNK